MNALTNLLEPLRSFDLERRLGLRAPFPPVVLQIERDAMTLVRLKRRGRHKPVLEAVQGAAIDPERMPSSIFHPQGTFAPDLPERLQRLFEQSGTKPGRISLVIPDNLAKVTLLNLPERPASNRQLGELVRSQMRRSVPFRLEDARLSWEVLPGAGKSVTLLVVLVRRQLIEQCEKALDAVGARVGLIDLCTTNLINLGRAQIVRAAGPAGADVALLNHDRNYFSLAILRESRLIFFRCKTFTFDSEVEHRPDEVLLREVANSFSYYREKLRGRGVGTLVVRSTALTLSEISQRLERLELPRIETIDATSGLDAAGGLRLDSARAQQIAPALGAAVGRA